MSIASLMSSYAAPIRRTVWLTVGTVALFYLAFTAAALMRYDGNPYWFVWLGERFQNLDPAGRLGYDGQFVYYIAVDGWAAAPHLDLPAYRFQRILLSLLTGWLGGYRPLAVAWSLIAVNLVAILATATSLAEWLRRQAISPWYAALYALYLGVFMAFSRDLTEPLAYGLAAAGMLVWLSGRHGSGVLLLALSSLAKEQSLLFPIGLGLHALYRRDWRAVGWLALTPLPLLAWEFILHARLGVWGVGQGSSPTLIPLSGILSQLTLEPGRLSGLLFVALPALALAGLCLARPEWAQPTWWVLLLHAVFVLLLPTDVYDHVMHAARNAAGLVLAATLATPWLRPVWRRGLLVAWVAPTLVWLIPVLRWAPWLSLR